MRVGAAVAGKGSQDKSGKINKGILVILAILVLAMGTGAGWYVFVRESPDDRPPPMPPSEDNSAYNPYNPPPYNVKMDKFEVKDMVVNLAGGGGRHYIRLSVVLEYPKEQKKLVEEIKEKEHVIKDNLVANIRTKTIEDVGNADELKSDLLKGVNSNLIQGRFTAIYFTDFLIQ